MTSRIILCLLAVMVLAGSVSAQTQNSLTAAKPEEQARIKLLIEAETKAREALNTKVATLPEAQAVRDAQAALEKANAALQKAADALPESQAWREAGAKVLDEAYRIQAAHGLSSREFKPELDAKGNLVFAKTVPPKP
jgi:hypothetical protein